MLVASHIESGDQAIAAVIPPSRCRTIPPFDALLAALRAAALRSLEKACPYKSVPGEIGLGAKCSLGG
jgi:hypothetical protein